MGQQQLLLIVLGIIVVGIAIVIGVNLFHSYSLEAKRNNIIDEGVNLASMAQQYFRRPSNSGGGEKSFTGWTIPKMLEKTANGEYTADVKSDEIVITAIGNEVVTANVPVEVKITIRADTYKVDVVH
ncbi:MAG: hypothetical protein ACM34K_04465 [Bacillota bacterium]